MIDASVYSLQKPLPAPPNPLEVAGKAMALQNMRQEQQINAERLKQEQLGNEQRQYQMQDAQTLRALQAQHGGDLDKVLADAAGKVHPDTFLGLQKHVNETKKQLGELGEQDRKKLDWNLGHLSDAALAILNAPPDQEQAVREAQAQRLQAAGIDGSKLLTADRNAIQAEAGYAKWIADQRAAAEAAQKATAATDTHAKVQAELPKIQTEAEVAQRQNDAAILANAAKQGPQALAAALQQIPEPRRRPFAGLAAQAKPEDILTIGMTPEQQVTTGLTRERNQQIADNEKRMRDIAQGNLNIAREHADIAKKVYDQTYGPGSNPALQGVEPRLRTQASREAQTAANEFTKAMESTAAVQTFIDLTRKGNKAAGSNLPLMGAESIQALNGIRRINRSEIAQYEGAGSLLDRIQGRVGKLVAGQPIPKDVLDDIEKLHQAIAGNATKAYNERLKSLNQNYHANFQPVGQEKQSDGAAHVNTKEEYDRLPSGATYIDAQDGKTYVKR